MDLELRAQILAILRIHPVLDCDLQRKGCAVRARDDAEDGAVRALSNAVVIVPLVPRPKVAQHRDVLRA